MHTRMGQSHMSHTRMGLSHMSYTRMEQSHTRIYIYIAIIIDHPVPSNFTGILWHWIIYFTLNNIQTPMDMYYLTVKMDLCPNKHATKATTAISVHGISYNFVEYFIFYNNNLPR